MITIRAKQHKPVDCPVSLPGSYQFNFSAHEKKVMRRRKYELPSVWAPKNLVVPLGRFTGSKMDMRVSPHLAGIMDAAVQPFVREINVCAAPQTGKSTLALAVFGWLAVFRPGPAFDVYPNENIAVRNMIKRIQPAFEASRPLKYLMTGRKEDKSKHHLQLSTMEYGIGWAGSVASLSDRSVKFLKLDELEKFAENVQGNEANAGDLAKIRCSVYPDHTIFSLSSPSIESGPIWTAIIQESEVVFTYWVPCPYCYHVQHMDFNKKSFVWPHGEDGHSIDRKIILSRKLARYVCSGCGREWDDQDRNRAIIHGRWYRHTGDLLDNKSYLQKNETLEKYLADHRPGSIGFLVPSWISYFVSLSQVAHDFLKSTDKKISAEDRFQAHKNFHNKHRSLPWRYDVEQRPVASVLALRDDRPIGIVPGHGQVATLVCGIDTQDMGGMHGEQTEFYLSIWAVGYGMQRDMWLVRNEFVQTFDALASVLWDSIYFDAAGNEYGVEMAFIDMLGHRTSEVIDFCVKYDGLIKPCFGSARDMGGQPYAFSQREFYPGTDVPIPGGLRSIKINTKWFKDRMHLKMKINPGSPGSLRLNAETSEEFCKHLVSESRDEKGKWLQIKGRANHYWDTLIISSVVADFLGYQHRQAPVMADIVPEQEVVQAKLSI